MPFRQLYWMGIRYYHCLDYWLVLGQLYVILQFAKLPSITCTWIESRLVLLVSRIELAHVNWDFVAPLVAWTFIYVFQHPNTAGATQRLPGGQILTIQPGAQSQPHTVVRQAVPTPVNVSRTQPGIRATMPQTLPTAVRTMAPGGGSSVSHGVGQPSGAAQGMPSCCSSLDSYL